MLSMEYPMSPHHPPYACSTMSSETLSGSCSSIRKNRVRTIRLVKHKNLPMKQGALGFSIRGGHEHGTGFFVSHVEVGSEAHSQGLKIGDQIIRINGFTIEDAVHKEVLQLISNYSHLILKVRSVGMIPVKDKIHDCLSWQIITDTDSSSRSSPQFGEKPRDVRISIMVAPRSKLGCGICKGPDWKPGIFVQFTKEGGIARDAGLRPGDQILVCNNVDFADIPFSEAVNLMKTSRQLDLVIRKAVATELFPGESSGYNSSASSVTEDQSPSWSETKRLSIVKEENSVLDDRISKRIYVNSVKWNLRDWEEDSSESTYYQPTIINLSDGGTTIKNNGTECQSIESELNNKSPDLCKPVPKPQETKTVVEVHRRSDDDENSGSSSSNNLAKSPSIGSFTSLASKSSLTSATSSSLSSAICLEIQRRAEMKAAKGSTEPTIDEQLQLKKMLKGVNVEQQQQHSKLMDEFKVAHQKMFKASDSDNPKQNGVIGKETMDRLAHKDLSQKVCAASSESQCKRTPENNRQVNANNPPIPPPPPPAHPDLISPPQSPPTRTNTLKANKSKAKAPPVPAKKSVLSFRQPPPCPTPDYDTLSISSSSSFAKPSQNFNDSVEMESLDSFKLKNPSNVKSRPPSIYFQKNRLSAQLSNVSVDSSVTSLSDLDAPSKPVNVTIREYSSPKSQPGRLNFLRNGNHEVLSKKDSVNSCFASELTQTLNRSNLRKRTESMGDLLDSQEIKPQSNGSVRISLNRNLSKELAKSTNDLTEDFEYPRQRNRVMINVNHYQEKTSNGLLKQSYGK